MKKNKVEKRPAQRTMDQQMAARGYMRVGEASEKIGRPPQFIHRAIKLPSGGNNGPRLSRTTAPPEWIRAGYLYYVYEPALRRLVGDAAADMVGLRTEAQLRRTG